MPLMNALLLAIAIAAGSPTNAPVEAQKTVMTTPAGKKLTCGAPQALATDSRQTVRVCEPVKR